MRAVFIVIIINVRFFLSRDPFALAMFYGAIRDESASNASPNKTLGLGMFFERMPRTRIACGGGFSTVVVSSSSSSSSPVVIAGKRTRAVLVKGGEEE